MGDKNPRGELMCCISCGRDTSSKSGYCAECRGGRDGTGRSETKDRKAKSRSQIFEHDGDDYSEDYKP